MPFAVASSDSYAPTAGEGAPCADNGGLADGFAARTQPLDVDHEDRVCDAGYLYEEFARIAP